MRGGRYLEICVRRFLLYNIPQTEQHEPKGQMLFCLGNEIICWMLPLATHYNIHYHIHPGIPLCVIRVQVAMLHPDLPT